MKKKLLILIGSILLFIIVLIVSANTIISSSTQSMIFDDINTVKANKVGLLLGTSNKLSDGRHNLFFQYRIDVAVQLYRAHKIDYILVSGDNHIKYYNEPEDMKKALLAQGVPDSAIVLDFAGFRTFDSVVRCKEVFGQETFTIISQKFHNERALYIAKSKNINAIAFNAKDVAAYDGFKTKLREKFARVKVFIDLLFDNQPRFLGEKIIIGK